MLHIDRSFEARSRTASYRVAARQREMSNTLFKVKKLLEERDPANLIPRPSGTEGWRRVVQRAITLSSFEIEELDGVEAQEYPRSRPRLKSTRADRAIQFIETFCKVPEGPMAGQPVVLEKFQKRFIRDVLDNKAITRRAILSIGKKNGKTCLIAMLLLVFLVGPEARANSQIVSGAMEREQAAIIFNYTLKTIEQDPLLRLLVNPVESRKRLEGLLLGVEYRALAAVARSTQGISPILSIMDEIGQVRGPSSDFVDAVSTAQGAYKDGLMVVISTQAADDSDLLSTWIDDALKADDGRKVCHLYAAPAGCDLLDEVAWAAANPGLGTIRSKEDLANLASDASRLPSFAASFRNLNLNQRVSTATNTFVPPDIWEKNAAPPSEMKGKKIYGGLDLSAVRDLTACVFESLEGDVWPFFWLPAEGLREKAKNDKVPYVEWKDKGLLLTTPGASVEYEHVAEFLRGVFDTCDVQAIGFDRQFMRHLLPWLVKAGFTKDELARFIEVGQGFMSMAHPIRTLESKLLNGKLRHGGNPVLRMCVANAAVEQDAAGNRKFNKQRAFGRIDGLVALTMAEYVMPGPEGGSTKKFQMLVL